MTLVEAGSVEAGKVEAGWVVTNVVVCETVRLRCAIEDDNDEEITT